jgi:hypothetical protein
VRKRRHESSGLAAGGAALAASLLPTLWARIARRPDDSSAILAAIAGSIVIVINALILQSGSRPAPFVVNVPPAPPNSVRTNASEPRPSRPTAETRTTQTISARRSDPIAQLISKSARIMAVQRVLTDYGYGQIKRTGVLDSPTIAAIERFERQHKLPVTGRITDRLVSELAGMAGHPLE